MGKLLHNDKQRNCEDTFEKRKRSFIYLFIYLFILYLLLTVLQLKIYT